MVNWQRGHVVQSTTVYYESGSRKCRTMQGVVTQADADRLTITCWDVAAPAVPHTAKLFPCDSSLMVVLILSKLRMDVKVDRSTARQANNAQWCSIDSDANRAIFHPLVGL